MVRGAKLQKQDIQQERTRLTFSDIGLAPNTNDAMRYQIEIWVTTLIVARSDQKPPHHPVHHGINIANQPYDQRKVGIRISAPENDGENGNHTTVTPPNTTSAVSHCRFFRAWQPPTCEKYKTADQCTHGKQD